MKLVEIIEARDGGNKFCRDKEVVVNHCYDYHKKYCPKTCTYTVRMDSTNIGKVRCEK